MFNLSDPIYELRGYNETPFPEGYYGVEIESAGPFTDTERHDDLWAVTGDGSVDRGGLELVLRRPLPLNEAKMAVTQVYRDLMPRTRSSMRAGVHVHVNVNTWSLRRLMTFLAAYYCFEDAIVHRFGPDRQGNLFCMRLSDADNINDAIEGVLADFPSRGVSGFESDAIRYSALNLKAVYLRGSIEFRAMQTPTAPAPVRDWLSFLGRFVDNVHANFTSPPQVLEFFSGEGIETMAGLLFGNYADTVLEVPDAANLVEDGIHRIQHWVFTRNWEAN